LNFCSRTSIAAHEHFAGTGVRGDAYVFLPVAKRVWHDQEFNSHWATPDELHAIRAARRAGIVVRLYNPPPDDEVADPAVLVHRRADRSEEALQPLLAMLGQRWPIDLSGVPRLAICTHGTRDRCCAKFGFAAFQAARRLFETGASPFEPIESSHLGGDRFAATGVFFPSGSMYAHLDSVDLAALAVEEAAGRLVPASYRGGVFDPQLIQLVRVGLAQQGLLNDTAAPIHIDTHSHDDVEASVAGRRYHVRLKTAEVEFYGSCSALSASKRSHGRRSVVDHAVLLEG